jgi:putative adenylate-forming enzyme
MDRQNIPLIMSYFLRARWCWHFLKGERLQCYQEKHAQQSINYALQHSPFYRQHWAQHSIKGWRELPIVDKKLMMEHFSAFNTLGIGREEAMELALQAERSRDFAPVIHGVTVGLSSGTSGHRGLFLVSPQEQAAWAGTILARTLPQLRRLRVAFFLRSNSNLYEQVGGKLLQFRYFDLMQPLAESISSLNTFQPDIILGPPSLLGLLADAREQHTLHIQSERLISIAEVLEPQDKQRLERVFAVPVQQIYQCTEGLLAISCAHGSLHIQEDLVLLQFESLDEKSAEQGGRVTPIVTDLWRKTQPILRYRLNDVLRLSTQPCPCGSDFRVIEEIEGRCDDLCYFYTQDGQERPFFPDTLRRMILLADSRISDYRMTQEQAGQLHIFLTLEDGAPYPEIQQTVQHSVERTIAQYNCASANLEISEGFPALASGVKRRRIQRIRS